MNGRIDVSKLRGRPRGRAWRRSKVHALVRSRSGRGVHVWIFFPGIPVIPSAKRGLDLVQVIQSALQKVLEDFGADPGATGIERWGANWRNSSRLIDEDIEEAPGRGTAREYPRAEHSI